MDETEIQELVEDYGATVSQVVSVSNWYEPNTACARANVGAKAMISVTATANAFASELLEDSDPHFVDLRLCIGGGGNVTVIPAQASTSEE